MTGCKLTVVYEPIGVQSGDYVQKNESVFETSNSMQLPILHSETKQSLRELRNLALGENWIALARVLPRPYSSVELRDYLRSDNWIMITPNLQQNSISLVSRVDEAGNAYAFRNVTNIIKLSSSSFSALDEIRGNAYSNSSDSILWITDVYVKDSNTLYNIVPSLPAALDKAPYELTCDLTDSTATTVGCDLKNRFASEAVQLFEGSKESNLDIKVDFLLK